MASGRGGTQVRPVQARTLPHSAFERTGCQPDGASRSLTGTYLCPPSVFPLGCGPGLTCSGLRPSNPECQTKSLQASKLRVHLSSRGLMEVGSTLMTSQHRKDPREVTIMRGRGFVLELTWFVFFCVLEAGWRGWPEPCTSHPPS